jgi:hypothetical protein
VKYIYRFNGGCLRTDEYHYFLKKGLFIEETVGQEAHVKVCAEIDAVLFFILNGKVLFIRVKNFLYYFGSLPKIFISKLFRDDDYASCLH